MNAVADLTAYRAARTAAEAAAERQGEGSDAAPAVDFRSGMERFVSRCLAAWDAFKAAP